jgi:hypothetical protein
MRQNLIIALLAACVTLMLVHLVVTLTRPQIPLAYGQTTGEAGGNYIVATGTTVSGNESVVWIYDTGLKKLCCYQMRGQGIEYKGVRFLGHDFVPEWLVANRVMTPQQVEEATKAKK